MSRRFLLSLLPLALLSGCVVKLELGEDGYRAAPSTGSSAGEGTVWACSFYAWGEDSSSGAELEFADEPDLCFASEDEAAAHIEDWRGECESAFLDEGISDFACEATCDDTRVGC